MTERRRYDKFFTTLNDWDRRCYVARDLGFEIKQPDTWPNAAIEELIDLRRREGADAYYEGIKKNKAARACGEETP